MCNGFSTNNLPLYYPNTTLDRIQLISNYQEFLCNVIAHAWYLLAACTGRRWKSTEAEYLRVHSRLFSVDKRIWNNSSNVFRGHCRRSAAPWKCDTKRAPNECYSTKQRPVCQGMYIQKRTLIFPFYSPFDEIKTKWSISEIKTVLGSERGGSKLVLTLLLPIPTIKPSFHEIISKGVVNEIGWNRNILISFRFRLRRAHDAYDADFRFSLGHKGLLQLRLHRLWRPTFKKRSIEPDF